MSMLKTFVILALCLLAFASLALAQDSASGSEGGSESASGEGGSAPASGHGSKSKSGASGLQMSSPWMALASLLGASLYLTSA